MSDKLSVEQLMKIGTEVHLMGLTGFTYWFEFRERLAAALAEKPAERPQLSAERLETLKQIHARSKDDYASVGDEQDGFAMASLDVAWLLDFVVPAALLTGVAEKVPACPECGEDITKGHHSKLRGCWPAAPPVPQAEPSKHRQLAYAIYDIVMGLENGEGGPSLYDYCIDVNAKDGFDESRVDHLLKPIQEILTDFAAQVRREAEQAIEKECLDWVNGYAGPTSRDEFIGKLLEAIQRREESSEAAARLDEATNWHQFSPTHDEDGWCCKREQELRDEVMARALGGGKQEKREGEKSVSQKQSARWPRPAPESGRASKFQL
jgi:hypothetical protein